MIRIGTGMMRIKKYHDYGIICENCGRNHQIFYVYQQYFHILFIPFFPLFMRTIRCQCAYCNDTLNLKKKEEYLSKAKKPFYLYSGIIIVVGFIASVIVVNTNIQKQKREFVRNPVVGDVYGIVRREKDTITSYYLKVTGLESDTVNLLHGALQYNGYVSSMMDTDYFVKGDVLKVSKSDLQSYLDSGIINSVDRNYDSYSRFRVEK